MSEFIQKYQLHARTYTPKMFHGVPYSFFVLGGMPILPMERHYGDCYPLTLFFFSDGLGKWYWDDAEMLRIGRGFIDTILKDPEFLEVFIQKWLKLRHDFEGAYAGVTEAYVRDLSDADLIERLERIHAAYTEQYGIAIGVQDPFSMRADALWQDRFRARLGGRFDELFPSLVGATEYSFVEQEYLDRLSLLAYIQEDPERAALFGRIAHDPVAVQTTLPVFWERLRAHAAEYFFISNNYAVVDELDAAFFLKKVREDADGGVVAKEEIFKRQAAHEETLRRKQALIEHLGLSQEERILLHIADRFTWQQDERKKTMMKASHYLFLFLREIARRTGIAEAMLKNSYIHELGDVLLRGVRKDQEWQDRQDFCVCVNTKDGYELLSGQAAREVHEQLFPEPEKAVQEFRGMVASQGVARGIVKIVLKRDDVPFVTSGSVVVASMTRPEMVPAMQRACAIVTDEGGVTSHAAIVSRELKKPCIIGTKIATKVLRDGDEVEVDANVGVVRILKRAL